MFHHLNFCIQTKNVSCCMLLFGLIWPEGLLVWSVLVFLGQRNKDLVSYYRQQDAFQSSPLTSCCLGTPSFPKDKLNTSISVAAFPKVLSHSVSHFHYKYVYDSRPGLSPVKSFLSRLCYFMFQQPLTM